MKFVALFRKELREALPWLLLAAAVVLLFGGMALWRQVRRGGGEPAHFYAPSPGEIGGEQFRRGSLFAGVGTTLLLTAIGLGVVLAGRQFVVPSLRRTWAFTIHRSVPRSWIVLAKFLAAAVSLVLAVGATWTLLYVWASRPGVLTFPPRSQIYAEGWIYIVLGGVAYLGTALSAVSDARWYTTRTFGMAVATMVIVVALTCLGETFRLGLIVAGLLLLAVQVMHLVISREY